MSTNQSHGELFLDYLNGPDVAALAMTTTRSGGSRVGLDAQGRGATVIERMHLVPGAAIRPLQRAAPAVRRSLARREIVGDYVDNTSRAALEMVCSTCSIRSRATGRDHRRRRSHRHAHRRGHGVSSSVWHAGRRVLAHRRARHRLLERAPARSSVRFRRDPSFAQAGERQIRRHARARPRQT